MKPSTPDHFEHGRRAGREIALALLAGVKDPALAEQVLEAIVRASDETQRGYAIGATAALRELGLDRTGEA